VPAARRAFSQASAKAAFYLRERGRDRFIGERVLREINLIGRISHVQLRAQSNNTDKNTHSAAAASAVGGAAPLFSPLMRRVFCLSIPPAAIVAAFRLFYELHKQQ